MALISLISAVLAQSSCPQLDCSRLKTCKPERSSQRCLKSMVTGKCRQVRDNCAALKLMCEKNGEYQFTDSTCASDCPSVCLPSCEEYLKDKDICTNIQYDGVLCYGDEMWYARFRNPCVLLEYVCGRTHEPTRGPIVAQEAFKCDCHPDDSTIFYRNSDLLRPSLVDCTDIGGVCYRWDKYCTFYSTEFHRLAQYLATGSNRVYLPTTLSSCRAANGAFTFVDCV